MKLLVLGGTGFLGRAMVEASLARGCDVTTFNRGRTGDDVAGVESLRADRYDLEALTSAFGAGQWDAAIDCSGYVPNNVLAVSSLLSDRVEKYVFVSSVSAYAGWPAVPLDEDSPLLVCPPDAGPDFGSDTEDGPTRYGFQKAGCEAAVRHSFGEQRSTVLRPGVVLGPREYVGRLIWWLKRLAAGGLVVAPGSPYRTIQPIDVRDVASFAVACADEVPASDYNVTAPVDGETFGGLMSACIAATRSSAQLAWLSDDLLLAEGVRQWSEMPLWRTSQGVWQVDPTRALAAGLDTRPLAHTVRDTWLWMQSGAVLDRHERFAEIGLSPEKEAALLASRLPRTAA
jgi:nucleoside-diphosphate-sugar epimerase